MSRVDYSYDEDFSGQFALWQANCERSAKGLKGQEALRALESALLAMPRKRLIREALADDGGDVCTVGALVLAIRTHRGEDEAVVFDELRAADSEDTDATTSKAEALGVPRILAWKLVSLNDIELDYEYVRAEGPTDWPYVDGYKNCGISLRVEITPERRYERVLAWVRDRLVPQETT